MSNNISKPPISPFTEPEKPANVPVVPWNPALGLFFVIVLFFGSQIFSALILSAYAGAHHLTNAQANDWLTNSVPAQFSFILLAEATIVAGIYLFLRPYKLNLSAIGLRRPHWSDPVFGLAMLLPYFIVFLLATAAAKQLFPSLNVTEAQQLGFNNVQGSKDLWLTFASLVLLPPIGEEILVRGFLYSTLKKAFSLTTAVLLTSILFAAAHLSEGGKNGLLWIAAIDTFVLSLALIYLREKTGGLWASMTLHALKNGIAFVALFAPHLR